MNALQWKQTFSTTLLAGSLDIAAAFVNAYATRGVKPDVVLKYIASGVFGSAAFEGGYGMMGFGLFFHFVIAFACTAVFFVLYPKLKLLHHHIYLNSLLIALIAWSVTNLMIIPLSNTPPATLNVSRTAVAIVILFFCIGIPISIGAKKMVMTEQTNK